ncbi:sodium-extruding oxaloacetate decarboxylase subunit alpha [Vibrio breoganii]|uniref:sodium-extruding oxaloacetate decarboxylase subunit alpha n=1 Tax=Vibrio breoganii TaxID=553239 RepID=UPI000C865CD1|nr:sodium-extruding oxaloacetate decarboxylase subunit alpha [Vibrio breoganii]PMG92474.1 oxaloacetate decarboxylase subunit alpha [Vibrio breoganii]PMM81874.1 oxaloacetate decarboxylase subunit alpha [Vibrio breoganii]TKF86587.1 oxaloacetate decarboxylase subunit alpha [Vibrio breoganii]
MSKPLAITDVVLRDAHQSLFATRMRLEDMLPIAAELDKVGYWSLETWGGATFDSCIRFLGEDPWERLRELKKAMPNTPMQMLLRGQNLLGYRHYADDVVEKFVERAHANGMDVFRVFDAMNDVRNFEKAVKSVVDVGAHAQGTLSYTTSPVHNSDTWVDLAKRLEDLGCHSLCIKDMSGLLKPYEAEELITRIKAACDVPLALHCHATTGLSTATAVKAVEAGVDILDTAISSMSCTYGHTPTETVVAMLEGTERDTNLKLDQIEPIAAYFREVRKKYAKFEGQLKGVDSRILIAQVPGGMLTNMEGQLKEQGAADRLDEVLEEIPRVRKDLGYIPLVTPTSQIVGTQAVINVLTGERYKSITKETAGILKGEYGKAPAELNAELQQKVLDGAQPITCRPADKLEDEFESLTLDLKKKAKAENISLAEDIEDDVLTYALFPQVGLKFLKNRHNPSMFEPVPGTEVEETKPAPVASANTTVEAYSVKVDGQVFDVQVGPQGELTSVTPAGATAAAAPVAAPVASNAEDVPAPLAGNIFKVNVSSGAVVEEGDVLLILEAMKMETEVRAARGGVVQGLHVKEGDSVSVGSPLLSLA